MPRSPETLIKAALGDSLTAVLGLAALTFSHLASAGVTSLCDSRTIDPPDIDIHPAELTVELIDLGSSAPVDLDVTIDAQMPTLPAPPDLDAKLQRVFEVADNFESASVPASSAVRRYPVADLTPPSIEAEVSMNGSDVAEIDQDNEISPPAVSTRVPGLSDDDLRRYRNKMYRTDI